MHNKKNSAGVFACDLCDFTTKYNSCLPRHKRHAHGNKNNIYKCKECDFTSHFKDNLTRHKKNMHGKLLDYDCEFCDYTTKYKDNLQRHLKSMHGGKRPIYSCNKCNFQTRHKYYFQNGHQKIHQQQQQNSATEDFDESSSSNADDSDEEGEVLEEFIVTDIVNSESNDGHDVSETLTIVSPLPWKCDDDPLKDRVPPSSKSKLSRDEIFKDIDQHLFASNLKSADESLFFKAVDQNIFASSSRMAEESDVFQNLDQNLFASSSNFVVQNNFPQNISAIIISTSIEGSGFPEDLAPNNPNVASEVPADRENIPSTSGFSPIDHSQMIANISLRNLSTTDPCEILHNIDSDIYELDYEPVDISDEVPMSSSIPTTPFKQSKRQIQKKIYEQYDVMMNSEVSTEGFACNQCLFETKFSSDLLRHLRNVHAKTTRRRTYKCQKCKYTTKFMSNLRMHNQQPCNILKRKSSLGVKRKIKNYRHSDSTSRKSIFVSVPSTSDISSTTLIQIRKEMYKCNECEFQSDLNALVAMHNQYYHGLPLLKLNRVEIPGKESRPPESSLSESFPPETGSQPSRDEIVDSSIVTEGISGKHENPVFFSNGKAVFQGWRCNFKCNRNDIMASHNDSAHQMPFVDLARIRAAKTEHSDNDIFDFEFGDLSA